MNKELNQKIYAALQSVQDALSEVGEDDWDKVSPICSAINDSQELISNQLDEKKA